VAMIAIFFEFKLSVMSLQSRFVLDCGSVRAGKPGLSHTRSQCPDTSNFIAPE
jgi:hypothetical protein